MLTFLMNYIVVFGIQFKKSNFKSNLDSIVFILMSLLFHEVTNSYMIVL